MTAVSVFVLTWAIVFPCDPPDLRPASVVSVLPLPPSPPYAADDPRVRTWFLAYCLARQIDARGALLAKPDIAPDVANTLKLANLRDAETMFAYLALFNELQRRITSCSKR
jgi:hypothetical protein